MQTYNSVNVIVTEIEALFRNVTGRNTFLSLDRDIVQNAIIDAYQFVMLEYGVSTFKFIEEADTIDTTAGTSYIDLDEYVFKVVSGSVRIPAHEQLMGLIDEIAIFQSDPDLSATGIPTSYAYTASGDPNKIRLALYPIPDATYTIYLTQMKYPTDSITNFPTWLQSAIKYKAKALSCQGLGNLVHLKTGFNQDYEDVITKIKDGFNYDGPRHIGRRRESVGHVFREDGM